MAHDSQLQFDMEASHNRYQHQLWRSTPQRRSLRSCQRCSHPSISPPRVKAENAPLSTNTDRLACSAWRRMFLIDLIEAVTWALVRTGTLPVVHRLEQFPRDRPHLLPCLLHGCGGFRIGSGGRKLAFLQFLIRPIHRPFHVLPQGCGVGRRERDGTGRAHGLLIR
jgi:hypothetical protein